jgi:hypothetical protein
VSIAAVCDRTFWGAFGGVGRRANKGCNPQDQDRFSKICTVSPMPGASQNFRRVPAEKSLPANAFRGIPRHFARWSKKNKWCPEEDLNYPQAGMLNYKRFLSA